MGMGEFMIPFSLLLCMFEILQKRNIYIFKSSGFPLTSKTYSTIVGHRLEVAQWPLSKAHFDLLLPSLSRIS